MPPLRFAAPLAVLALSAAVIAAAPHAAPRAATAHRPSADTVSAAGPKVAATNDSVAGEYLTVVGGCNDCHTPGWDQSQGKTPPADRLVGSAVGYRGPWGTSYAANLRLVASRVSEDRWVSILTTADHGEGRPPMPWMNTALTNPQDLRAMYRYIKALGPKGERTPRPVAAGVEPTTSYVLMVPQDPKGGAAGRSATPARTSARTSAPQGARGAARAKP